MKKRTLIILIIILILNLFGRMAYFLFLPLPLDRGDSLAYDQLGLNLAAGRGYYFSQDQNPTAEREPIYPFFLAVIYFIFGHHYKIVYLIQSLVDTASCLLIFLLAKKIFESKTPALIAAGLYVFYIPMAAQVGVLMTEVIFTFGSLVVVYYLTLIWQKFTPAKLFLAGLLIGLLAMIRCSPVFFPGFLTLYLIWFYSKDWQKAIISILFLTLGTIIAVTPWVVRNYLVFDEFVLTTTRAGFNLLHDLRPKPTSPGELVKVVPDELEEQLKGKSESYRNKVLHQEALKIIKNDPKLFLRTILKRAPALWFNISRGQGIHQWRYYPITGRMWSLSYTLIIEHTLLLLLAAISFIWFRGAWLSRVTPSILFVLYMFSLHLIFIAIVRYSTPLMPYFIVVAAYSIYRIGLNFKQKETVL